MIEGKFLTGAANCGSAAIKVELEPPSIGANLGSARGARTAGVFRMSSMLYGRLFPSVLFVGAAIAPLIYTERQNVMKAPNCTIMKL